MTDYLTIHSTHPQLRLIRRVVEIIRRGGVIAYPTDSGYALGCGLGDKRAIERIRRIRQLGKEHNFTLMCRDLSEIAIHARINNSIFRLLKAHTPGAYTFILAATKEVPRRLQHPKRKTIGIRVPDNNIVQTLLAELNEPIMSVSLIINDRDFPLTDMEEIREHLEGQVDVIIDGGFCSSDKTSVIDLTGGYPVVLREGQGDVSDFL